MVSIDGDGNQTGEIEDLKQQLASYKSLEEDLMANRVFEKAKKKISTYVTLGGVIAILASIIGIKAVVEYAKELAKEKIDAIAADEIKKALQVEGERQITSFVNEKKTDFIILVQQQAARIAATSQPVGQTQRTESAAATSEFLDYSDGMSKVRNSGTEGSTVGFATAAALEFQIEKSLNQKVVISPRHIYYYSRLKQGTVNTDSGAQIRDAIDVLLKSGGVTEADWPYISGEFRSTPPKNITEATHFKLSSAQPVRNVKELKSALQTFGPVAGGFTVYDSMYGANATRTGILPLPSAVDKIIGAHAVCFVGFDDKKKLLKFQNQWGTSWGEKGYGYVSYEYAEKFLIDTWAVSIVK